jgi:hypothetical protein
MIQLSRRFASLDPADRRTALEAAVLIAMASIGLRFTRLLTLRAAVDRLVKWTATRADTPDHAAIESVRRAVARVARRVPVATCLVQALAVDVMLRRRHLPSELRFGVRRLASSASPIEAHAWVDCGGATIGVTEDQADFKVLAR